ncbi:unnamed protein product, partial [marine sediment metagenome]
AILTVGISVVAVPVVLDYALPANAVDFTLRHSVGNGPRLLAAVQTVCFHKILVRINWLNAHGQAAHALEVVVRGACPLLADGADVPVRLLADVVLPAVGAVADKVLDAAHSTLATSSAIAYVRRVP